MSIDLVHIAVTSGPSSTGASPKSAHPSASASLPLDISRTPPTAPESPPNVPQKDDKVEVNIDSSQHIIYRVVDQHSGEVVQQIPPEELLRVMRNIGEYLADAQAKVKTSA